MKDIATRFVSWQVPELASLKDSKVYRLRERLNSGEKMNREEKNWLTEAVNNNSFSRHGVPLLGYLFDFADVLRKYWVRQYGQITEYYATDKTALRKMLHGRIDQIVELN